MPGSDTRANRAEERGRAPPRTYACLPAHRRNHLPELFTVDLFEGVDNSGKW